MEWRSNIEKMEQDNVRLYPVVRGQASLDDHMNIQSASLKPEGKFSTGIKFAKVALVVLFIAIVIFALINFDLSELQILIEQHQRLTLVIGLSAIFITGLTFIPTAPVTLFLSLLIGPLLAIVVTTLGNTITALVHYQLGKQIGDVVDFEQKKAKLPFKLGKLPINSPLFLLIGRGLPGGPKGLSFVCGAYGVPYFLYLWTTILTELIGAVFIAYGGNLLSKL